MKKMFKTLLLMLTLTLVSISCTKEEDLLQEQTTINSEDLALKAQNDLPTFPFPAQGFQLPKNLDFTPSKAFQETDNDGNYTGSIVDLRKNKNLKIIRQMFSEKPGMPASEYPPNMLKEVTKQGRGSENNIVYPILFLQEGFTAAEQGEYQAVLADIVNSFATNQMGNFLIPNGHLSLWGVGSNGPNGLFVSAESGVDIETYYDPGYNPCGAQLGGSDNAPVIGQGVDVNNNLDIARIAEGANTVTIPFNSRILIETIIDNAGNFNPQFAADIASNPEQKCFVFVVTNSPNQGAYSYEFDRCIGGNLDQSGQPLNSVLAISGSNRLGPWNNTQANYLARIWFEYTFAACMGDLVWEWNIFTNETYNGFYTCYFNNIDSDDPFYTEDWRTLYGIDSDGNTDLTCIKKNTTAFQNASGTLVDMAAGNTIGVPALYREPGRGVMYPDGGTAGSPTGGYDYSSLQFQAAKDNLGF
jgi:hypothetical protein